MRKNFGAEPFLYPQLVMVIASYSKDGTADAMNAAWGGIAGGDKIFLCLSSNHKTVENILERRPSPSAWRTRPIWWRPTMWGWSQETMCPTSWSGAASM